MSLTAQSIIESIPFRFRTEKAAGFNTTFHFDIAGEEVLQYTVRITDQVCRLENGLNGQPDCLVKTKASLYIDLETGKANPQMALMLGRIKISNLPAMMQFSKCFRRFDPAQNYAAAAANGIAELSEANFLRRPEQQGPLKGVRILDFTRLLPGPLATMFLADMGADVVKIEDPDNPDYIRDFEPRVNGMSMFYLSLNRGKRSLAVNYLTSQGKEIIYDLVKTADVLVEQYRPGVMDELGFGYEKLKTINPRLIYVSITGYGQKSSMATAAGHDLNYVALSGGLGITGTETAPVIPGFQLADIAGGSYMAMNAVTAALFSREKTGKGDWIDVAMTDAALPFNALQFAYFQGTKEAPARGRFQLSGGLANYNVYPCADGKWIALGSLEPKFWNRFCDKVNHPEWSNLFLSDGATLEKLKQDVRNLFLSKTRAAWLQFFQEEDICITKVNELSELHEDAYLIERGMFVDNEHKDAGKYKTINQPLKFAGAKLSPNWSAPDLGDDTGQILRELKIDDQKIRTLWERGVVKLI